MDNNTNLTGQHTVESTAIIHSLNVNIQPDCPTLLKPKRKRKEYICGIYKITSPKNRVYIGQSVDIGNRFRIYRKMGKTVEAQWKLFRSFTKHGIIKHKFEIIHLCTREELNDLEVYYIDLYQSCGKNGLNLKGGGTHGEFSEETKEKMRYCQPSQKKVIQYGSDGKFIKIWNNLSEAARGVDADVANISYSVLHPEEHKVIRGFIWKEYKKEYPTQLSKDEIRISQLTGKERAVNQYTLDGELIREWDGLSFVARELGYKTSRLSLVCLDGSNSAYGYLWRYKDDNSPFRRVVFIRPCREIIQYSKSGQELRRWNGWREIKKELGYNKFAIFNCCRGITSNSYDFIWRYANGDYATPIIPIAPLPMEVTIVQYSLKGELIRKWDSAKQVEKELGFRAAQIADNCKGKLNTAFSFIWKFENDNSEIKPIADKKSKPIIQYDLVWNEIARWRSIAEAAKNLGIDSTTISYGCKFKSITLGKFRFTYANDLKQAA